MHPDAPDFAPQRARNRKCGQRTVAREAARDAAIAALYGLSNYPPDWFSGEQVAAYSLEIDRLRERIAGPGNTARERS